MEKTYSVGNNIIEVVQYPISFTYTYLQPTITGPSYVYSGKNNSFSVDSTNYDLERITVTNASYTYNDSTGELVIYNVSNDVTVSIVASSKNLCTLKLAGHNYADKGQYYGYWPATGTIKYRDKYGIQRTFNVANANLNAFNVNYYMTDAIMEGTDVICTNIALSTNYGNPSYRNVRFYAGEEISSYLVYTGPGTGSSYTFENVQSRGSGIRVSLVIASSGY